MGLFLVLFSLLLPGSAKAEDCWNADKSFYNCDTGSSGAGVGASAPLIGDTMESNPAALPAQPTPFGLEGTVNDRSFPTGRPKFSVSTVKGFDGIGFGIGAWSDGTFNAPDFPQHFLSSSATYPYMEYERNPPSVLGIRLGGSLLLPRGPFPKGVRFSLGGSLGLGRVDGEISPQVGLLAMFLGLGFGYSESYEHLAKSLPRTRISNYAAGVHFRSLYLGYTYSVMKSDVNRTFTNIFSARWVMGNWTVHGGIKLQKDHRGLPDVWHRAGLHRKLSKRISVGYEYGTYRHSHGMALQFFF